MSLQATMHSFGSSSERFLMDRPNKKSPRKKESPSMGAQPARIPAMSHATRASIAEEEVKAEKDKYLQMKPKVKRKCYKCVDDFMTLDDIVPWSNYSCTLSPKKKSSVTLESSREGKYTVNEEFNKKISLIRADITKLEIDAIVNAANKSLLGGGGVDGAIHAAAGPFLKRECALLDGCETGEAKITCGYNLPAKYVIHTVGPIGENKERLESAYKNCLKLVQENQLKSVAFPCISTGIYGYPVESASHVALGTIRKWMDREEYSKEVKCVILCVFLKKDVEVYEELLKVYFPRASSDSPEVSASKDETEGAAKDAEKESSTELKAKKDSVNSRTTTSSSVRISASNRKDRCEAEQSSDSSRKEEKRDSSRYQKEDKDDQEGSSDEPPPSKRLTPTK